MFAYYVDGDGFVQHKTINTDDQWALAVTNEAEVEIYPRANPVGVNNLPIVGTPTTYIEITSGSGAQAAEFVVYNGGSQSVVNMATTNVYPGNALTTVMIRVNHATLSQVLGITSVDALYIDLNGGPPTVMAAGIVSWSMPDNLVDGPDVAYATLVISHAVIDGYFNALSINVRR